MGHSPAINTSAWLLHPRTQLKILPSFGQMPELRHLPAMRLAAPILASSAHRFFSLSSRTKSRGEVNNHSRITLLLKLMACRSCHRLQNFCCSNLVEHSTRTHFIGESVAYQRAAALSFVLGNETALHPGIMVITNSHLTTPHDGGLYARHLPHLMRSLFVALLFVGAACAQDQPALNEFTTWFGGQFANKHAFSETNNGRLYRLETRFSRLIYAVVPMALVGDPWHTKGRQYAYGGGGSPMTACSTQLTSIHCSTWRRCSSIQFQPAPLVRRRLQIPSHF